jgi:hypothetical protein
LNDVRSQHSTPRHRRTLFILVFGLLLLAGLGVGAVKVLCHERHVISVLRHSVEGAAAPDETIVVSGQSLAILLQRFGSSALKQPLVVAHHGVLPDALLQKHDEMIVVAAEDDALLADLRAKGFTLISDTQWDESAMAKKVPVHGAVRIYFVVAPGGFVVAPGGFVVAPGGFVVAPGGFVVAPGGFVVAPAAR